MDDSPFKLIGIVASLIGLVAGFLVALPPVMAIGEITWQSVFVIGLGITLMIVSLVLMAILIKD